MISANTQIAGWNSQMARVPAALRAAAKDANEKSQAEAQKRLIRATPIGPGHDHIRATIETLDGDASKLEKIVRIGSSALAYAIPLEFGHKLGSKIIPGTRFFRSVRRIMAKKHRNRMRTAIRKALKALNPR
jgi:hypothetical protein